IAVLYSVAGPSRALCESASGVSANDAATLASLHARLVNLVHYSRCWPLCHALLTLPTLLVRIALSNQRSPMAKKTSRSAKSAAHFSLTIEGDDAPWARVVERVAKEQGKSVEQAMTEALRDWLWQASGLKRLFEQFREANEHMTRAFQVEGMLVRLAKS